MSTNLVASAVKLVTPELMSRIAAMVGVDQATIEKAVTAGIPGLLAAFAALVNRPGGAARLADSVAQQQPGTLTNIANAAPAQQRDLIESGGDTLSSLLGAGTFDAFAGALSRYTGLGEAATKGLLGLLGPMLMSLLGQQQRGGSLNASGLARLLQSQQSNIARAVPSGFAEELSDAGIAAQVPGMSRPRPEAAYGSQWNWLAPVLGALAIGALGWYLLSRPHEPTVAQVPAPVHTAEVPEIIVTADEEKGWMGRPVFSNDNQKVGEIIEIRRGPDNKVTDIYFDAGTFLGLGAKRYHVTAKEIAEVKPNGVVVTMKEADVKALPEAPGTMGQ
jgi:hypothetical protein